MVLFFRHKKPRQVIAPPIIDLKQDPTTKEVEKIKRQSHQGIDQANEVVNKFKERVKVENHFTMQIIHILGGKR